MLGLCLVACTTDVPRAPAPIAIVPRPVVLTPADGSFVLDGHTRITAPAALASEAQMFAARFRTTPLAVAEDDASAGIVLALDPSLDPEAYVLDVDPERVRIRGGSAAGVFWATQTLLQLLPPDTWAGIGTSDALRVPAVHVEDAPRFAYRGLLLDEARWFFGADFVRRVIDWMALHKLDVLHWHLTDDQGWRIPIPGWPLLTEVGSQRAGSQHGEWFGETREVDPTPEGGAYAREELVALVAYAAERHITIVPEIDLPGHTVAALAAYPSLACTDGPFEVSPYFEIHDDVLCVCEDGAMTFAEDVLTEVMAIFPSETIHVGGDEVPTTRWQADPLCAQRASELGLGSVDDLHGWFVGELSRFCAAHGRRAQVWNEARSGALDPSAIVQVWRGDAPAEARVAAMRGELVTSPAEETYLNRSYAQIPMTTSYAFEPTRGLDATLAPRVLGLEACMWTPWDGTERDVEAKTFPRMAAYAEVGWTSERARDWDDFATRLPAMRARYEALGIRATPP